MPWLITRRMAGAHLGKVVAAGVGVTAGFVLALAQVGMMLGWIETSTLGVSRAEADLWVVGEKSPAFDYGSPIPRQRLYQARSVEGVAWAEPLFMAWTVWKRPDGRQVNIEMVGVDRGLVGGPERMEAGRLRDVMREKSVVVDAMYLDLLGVEKVGDRHEIQGRRADVVGISEGVRTFTASPFVFTSIEDAIRYDQRYRHDEITYVMVKCEPGVAVDVVAERLRRMLPSGEVLTAEAFRLRSARYWMVETGIGFSVVVTALLGVVIGGLVVSQTLFGLLQDHRPHYATMLALGFRERTLAMVVMFQAVGLWVVGAVGGLGVFLALKVVAESSPVPLRMTFPVLAGLWLVQLATCLGAGKWVLAKVRKLDPVTVFS
ncbi:ABC transporter permease [Akkermansiaceae bacterium]|nr:ABC transporter permease [Akkermansiaceae bacterium]